jgi:hypothetical protein
VSGGRDLGIAMLPDSFNIARVFIGSGDLSRSELGAFAHQYGIVQG